jgi:hypothetical protein
MSLQKIKAIKDYERNLARMISDADIKNTFGGDTKIIKYSELKNYKTFFDLLTENNGSECFCVVLTESDYNEGHWCCLFRTKNDEIYWFDSYGIKPDGELKLIPERIRKMLGENSNELQRLIKTVPKGKFHYLKEKHQVLKDGINTCGRWCMIYIKMCLMGFSIDEINEFILRKSQEHGKPPDILAVDWTPT